MKRSYLKKLSYQIALTALVLFLVCLFGWFFTRGSRRLYINYVTDDPSKLEIEVVEGEGIVDFGEICRKGAYLILDVYARKVGKSWVSILDENGESLYFTGFTVDKLMTVHDSATYNFGGDWIVIAGLGVFLLSIVYFLVQYFFHFQGSALYSYNAIFAAGLVLFVFEMGIPMIVAALRSLIAPEDFLMIGIFSGIASAPAKFMIITFPFILIFSVAMIISNVVLLRKEGMRFSNVLGILVSICLVAGETVNFFAFSSFAGSILEYRIFSVIENLYCSVYVYFECMLAGSIICGIHAVKQKPAFDKDFIIILGCAIKRDGSLTPLLKGRVDRALDFWTKQRNATGKVAVIIPSGGQGTDEVMAESEAMRRYILSEYEVPAEYVIAEKKSKNTYENMEFSKKIIEERMPNAKTVFSTTNYHVFRSGIWAVKAGLDAEGIGSRTKWWFWPNAFMRECVGLIQNKLKQEAILLFILAAVFAGLAMRKG